MPLGCSRLPLHAEETDVTVPGELLNQSADDIQEYFCQECEDEGEGEPEEQGFIHWPRDPQLDPAKAAILEWFGAHPDEIFYGRQIEVILEKRYFHWITHKALKELTKEGAILSELRTTEKRNVIRLYWSKRLRYSRRAAQRLAQEVDAHYDSDLSRAIGHHAENLFGFAAGRAGFKIVGQNVRSYGERTWLETDHELDWIFERDGVAWGVEIKNTWAYIDRPEMYAKMDMCDYLGLRTLFIMRWAPKSYVNTIRERNGFGLLYEDQYFPPGHTSVVENLRGLYLPVSVVTATAQGVFERFVRWHERGLRV
ncbi:MAG: hypothetical protein HY646_16005 [Acidobacteria bacterium]|nr:hypothetical protein [Acidobacteriota bacterium]